MYIYILYMLYKTTHQQLHNNSEIKHKGTTTGYPPTRQPIGTNTLTLPHMIQ